MVDIVDGTEFLEGGFEAQLDSLVQCTDLEFLLYSSNTAA